MHRYAMRTEFGRCGLTGMVVSTMNGASVCRVVTGAFALCLSVGAVSASVPVDPGILSVAAQVGSTDLPKEDVPPFVSAGRFDDAPYGVDATITGPVSTAFRERREAAHCDEAVWPAIPALCYPD
jgi:hypothetical protein